MLVEVDRLDRHTGLHLGQHPESDHLADLGQHPELDHLVRFRSSNPGLELD